MRHRVGKGLFGAAAAGVLLAGCATTVDWGGPLGHYRYNYDSRPVVSESTVTVPAPAVTYSEPAVTYSAPAVTYSEPAVTYSAPAVTYSAPAATTYTAPVTTYGTPVTTYRESGVVYREPKSITYYGPSGTATLYPTPSLPYSDHGQ